VKLVRQAAAVAAPASRQYYVRTQHVPALPFDRTTVRVRLYTRRVNERAAHSLGQLWQNLPAASEICRIQEN
jgi:hypothetical protein